jgi:DNA-binding TFAR19-related protein (PDSD5 family)
MGDATRKKETIKTVKFAPEIDGKLYEEMVDAAKENGHTQRYVLEQALRHYLRNVLPSQHLVRPEVMDAFEQSVAHNRKLLERLAK